MDKRRYAIGTVALAAMLVMILDGKTAVQAANEGIMMCLRTVIPSLFPFFLLSSLINSSFVGAQNRLLSPLGNLFGICAGAESILIPAFLGGYPVGAMTIAQQWRKGVIPQKEAERMLGFCNNAGPSFIFGMASVMFPKAWMAWLLWGIQILSALITAQFLPGKRNGIGVISQKTVSVPEAMHAAISSMATVCGWVLCFRVLIGFLERWVLWIFPDEIQVLAIGGLELSNGCMALQKIENVGLRFMICSGMLSFGGICVMMQVASATQGLSLKWFFKGKLIQTLVSLGLAWAAVSGEYIVFGFLLLLVPMVFLKSRKNGSIPSKAGV